MKPETISPMVEYEFSMLVAAAVEGFNASNKLWFANYKVWQYLVERSDLPLYLRVAGKEPGREFKTDFYRSFSSAMKGHGFFRVSRAFIGGSRNVSFWKSQAQYIQHMAKRPVQDRGANRYTVERSWAHYDRQVEWTPWT